MAENAVNPSVTEELTEEKLNEVLKVRREKLEALVEAGKDPFAITKYDRTHHSSDIKENFEELEGKEVSVAGRLMSKRIMGKASFCNVQDLKGNIQSYVARDAVGEDEYSAFKKLDIGDIVGIKGTVFKTKRARYLSTQRTLFCLQRAFRCFRRNFTDLQIPIFVTVRDMLILLSIRKCATHLSSAQR